jgi:hypothetical protein
MLGRLRFKIVGEIVEEVYDNGQREARGAASLSDGGAARIASIAIVTITSLSALDGKLGRSCGRRSGSRSVARSRWASRRGSASSSASRWADAS